MKGVLFSFLLFFSNWALGGVFYYPFGSMYFLQTPPKTVYFNEEVRIPVRFEYYNLAIALWWIVPNGTYLQLVSGVCPSLAGGLAWMGSHTCDVNLVIPGTQMGRVVSGMLGFHADGKSKNHWDVKFESPWFSVEVIPHCPSMLNVPLQQATADQEFSLNLRSYIKYYDENLKGNSSIQPLVTPAEQDGLRYDPQRQSIVGTPTRLGIYNFTVGAKSSRCTAEGVPVAINVKANIKDRPVFKTSTSMSAGIPKQRYSMNLLELLQPQTGFMMKNQVHFRLHPNMNNPAWLHMSPTDATQLEGTIPAESAGRTEQVTLIASSNTGGDSEPLTVNIPVTFDPDQQPKVRSFALERLVGQRLDFDITSFVDNPSNEPFQLFIDKVEPLAPWLTHTSNTLQGTVPLDVPGQLYQMTFHVSTSAGGSSKPVTVPLQIAVDKDKTPDFNKSINLPEAEVGRSYLYDFNINNDVSPYNIPYQIELARDYPTPGWVTIKNNQLIVKEVPESKDPGVTIYVVLKNIPGGQSRVKELYLKLFSRNEVKD